MCVAIALQGHRQEFQKIVSNGWMSIKQWPGVHPLDADKLYMNVHFIIELKYIL